MAYAQAGLNPGAENAKGGPFISSYHTLDAKAVIEGAGYFNSAATQLDNSQGHGFLIIIDTTNSLFHFRGYTVIAGVVLLIDPDIT